MTPLTSLEEQKQPNEERPFAHQPVKTKHGVIAPMWEMDDVDARRRAIIRRAARGARRALGKRDVIVIEPTAPPQPMVVPITLVIPDNTQTWRRIILETAIKHNIMPAEMLSAQRAYKLVIARHEVMYRMKTETTMSLPAIGRRLGKDHTTVLHGVRRHIERMEAANAGRTE